MEKEKPKPLCWGCGYCLEGAVAKRCPECGRAFDFADPKTFNPSGVRKWWKRRLMLRPMGNFAVGVAAVATTALLVVTRPSVEWLKFDFTFPDVQWVFSKTAWQQSINIPATCSWVMAAFLAALAFWGLVLLGTLSRGAMRFFLRRSYGELVVKTPRWRIRAMLAMFFISLLCAILGQDFRLAHQFVSSYDGWGTTIGLPGYIGPKIPDISIERAEQALRTGMRRLPTAKSRMWSLKILSDFYPASLRSMLPKEIPLQSDVAVKKSMIHLAGLHRNAPSIAVLSALLDDADPQIRAAAIDAIGMIHCPAWGFPMPNRFGFWGPSIISDPPIAVNFPSPSIMGYSLTNDSVIEVPPAIRERIENFMLSGQTQAEREAAARALVKWQSAYNLRVAEWGVWIASPGGSLVYPQSLQAEIPPFVHRAGNPAAEFVDRLQEIWIIDKPVVHVTVDKPMAVDMEVQIRRGRPNFVYPHPDDFEFSTVQGGMSSTSPIVNLDPPATFPKLESLSGGYPWLTPQHRTHGSMGSSVGGANLVADLGVRWQSMIVTPSPLASSKIEVVGSDPNFAWWSRLRQVPSSYVTSRGETERFIYYDGPTNTPAPLTVALQGERLHFSIVPFDGRSYDDETFKPLESAKIERRGVFVRVRDGVARAGVLRKFDMEGGSPIPLLQNDAPAVLRRVLTDAGLTKEEADGMIDAWTPAFFQKDGDRFLMLLPSEAYDFICPIAITPKPTKLVRCGIILTEFGTAR